MQCVRMRDGEKMSKDKNGPDEWVVLVWSFLATSARPRLVLL